jgi:hypothetical protein
MTLKNLFEKVAFSTDLRNCAWRLPGTDQDQYQYDPNTGRMTNWTFQVGSTPQTETGTDLALGRLARCRVAAVLSVSQKCNGRCVENYRGCPLWANFPSVTAIRDLKRKATPSSFHCALFRWTPLGRAFRTAPVSRQTNPNRVWRSPRFHSRPATLLRPPFCFFDRSALVPPMPLP